MSPRAPQLTSLAYWVSLGAAVTQVMGVSVGVVVMGDTKSQNSTWPLATFPVDDLQTNTFPQAFKPQAVPLIHLMVVEHHIELAPHLVSWNLLCCNFRFLAKLPQLSSIVPCFKKHEYKQSKEYVY